MQGDPGGPLREGLRPGCASLVRTGRDFERLSARATELRGRLAEAPIVATSDALPAAFSATLGRVLPLGGTGGVALLLTMVVELISCTGLAGLRALRHGLPGEPQKNSPSPTDLKQEGVSPRELQETLPRAPIGTLPGPSLGGASLGGIEAADRRAIKLQDPPSNVLPIRRRLSPTGVSPSPQER